MDKKKQLSFIAEICQNHQGKFYNIQKMVEECVSAGANIIKAQYIFSKNLTYRPIFDEGLKIKNKLFSIKRPYHIEKKRLKKLDLKKKDYEKFVKICENLKVKPMITCFAREHINELKNMGFKSIKVASYDCSSFQLIRELKSNFKKLIISTGATFDNEIKYTANILKNYPFVLMHCVSIYPTPKDFLNLNRIKFLKKLCKDVGYSDHSSSLDNKKNLACLAAITAGATYIERHITILDKDKTRDGKVSINPSEIKEIIKFSRLNNKDKKEYLKEKYKVNVDKLYGKEKRELTNIELLNRDYYKGRFASNVSRDGLKFINNWDETKLNV